MPLLEVRGLARSFYGVHALNGVDLDVRAGTITGLIGPNGAGKTTLFNCVSGLIPPEARHRASSTARTSPAGAPDRVTRRGLVRTFQIARGFPRLSVLREPDALRRAPARRDAVEGVRAAGGAWRRRERALPRARLRGGAAPQPHARARRSGASRLSGGQKKLLELGRALMTDPRLILLDEPIAGVNPTLAARDRRRTSRRCATTGYTFLIIEHHLDVIARLCDPVIVMAEGRHLAAGDVRRGGGRRARAGSLHGRARQPQPRHEHEGPKPVGPLTPACRGRRAPATPRPTRS